MDSPIADPGKQSLLAPRLYRTDIDELNRLSIDWCRQEFDELRRDFEADYNRAHFKWGEDVKGIDYQPLWDEFYEFLHRSSIGEFSGCLLYADVYRKLKDPTLAAIYQCMSRDEGRHASFLNWVMRDMGRPFDLARLPKIQGLQYMHPRWIFVTTYLSELVGYYRYQNISDHLKKQPAFKFHPIFDYFDAWCKDERRHSRFFALMMRSQPHYYDGPLNQLGIKFFTLAVYITMYLRDSEARVYEKLGIDWEHYDLKVVRETEIAARGVWGLAIRTDSKHFRSCLRAMAENNRRNKKGRSTKGIAAVGATIMRYARWGNQIVQYAKLMVQPHDRVTPLPREQWIATCSEPGDVTGLRLGDAKPTILPRIPAGAAPA